MEFLPEALVAISHFLSERVDGGDIYVENGHVVLCRESLLSFFRHVDQRLGLVRFKPDLLEAAPDFVPLYCCALHLRVLVLVGVDGAALGRRRPS